MGNLCGGSQRKGFDQSTGFMNRVDYSQNYRSNSTQQSKQIIQNGCMQIMENMIKNCDQSNPLYYLQNCIIQAKENEDLNYLIDMINNDQKLILPIDMGHPWASNPKSIGSLATMYLCLFFIKEPEQSCSSEQHEENIIQKYFQAFNQKDTNSKIFENLNHKDKDRLELTVLLLVFIVEFDQQLEQQQKQQQKQLIFSAILELFNLKINKKCQFKVACLYILKELFKDSLDLAQQFINSQDALDQLLYFAKSDNINLNFEMLFFFENILQDSNYKLKLSQQDYDKIFQKQFLNPLLILQDKIQEYIKKGIQVDDLDLEQLQCQKTFISYLIQKIQQHRNN